METQWSEPTCPAPIDMYLLQVAVIPEGSQDPADAGILPVPYNSTPPSSLYSSSHSKELLQFYRIATSPSVFFLVVPPLPSFPLFFCLQICRINKSMSCTKTDHTCLTDVSYV